MDIKIPVNNCVTCGQFFSTQDSYPYCKKCFDLLCLNCWDVHLIPSNLLHKIPHFCDAECEAEFTAIKEVARSISDLTKGIDVLRRVNLQVYGTDNYRYEDGLIFLEYDSKLKVTNIQLKVNHNPFVEYKFDGVYSRTHGAKVSGETQALKLAQLELAYEELRDNLLLNIKP